MKKVMVLCCMLAGVAFSQAPAMKKFSTMLGGDYVAVTNPVAVMSNHLATAAHFTPAQYVQVTNTFVVASNALATATTNSASIAQLYATKLNVTDGTSTNQTIVSGSIIGDVLFDSYAFGWDSTLRTFSFDAGNGVTGNILHELWVNVMNQTGGTITNGMVVRYAGTVGASGLRKGALMVANGSVLPGYTLGIATEDIPNGSMGKVTSYGIVHGLKTGGNPNLYGEDWSDLTNGAPVYVSTNKPGFLTRYEPQAWCGRKILVGSVDFVHQTQGFVSVRPKFYDRPEELDGVNGTTPTEGSLMVAHTNACGVTYYDFDRNLNDYASVASLYTLMATSRVDRVWEGTNAWYTFASNTITRTSVLFTPQEYLSVSGAGTSMFNGTYYPSDTIEYGYPVYTNSLSSDYVLRHADLEYFIIADLEVTKSYNTIIDNIEGPYVVGGGVAEPAPTVVLFAQGYSTNSVVYYIQTNLVPPETWSRSDMSSWISTNQYVGVTATNVFNDLIAGACDVGGIVFSTAFDAANTVMNNHLATANPHPQYPKMTNGSVTNLSIVGGNVNGDTLIGAIGVSNVVAAAQRVLSTRFAVSNVSDVAGYLMLTNSPSTNAVKQLVVNNPDLDSYVFQAISEPFGSTYTLPGNSKVTCRAYATVSAGSATLQAHFYITDAAGTTVHEWDSGNSVPLPGTLGDGECFEIAHADSFEVQPTQRRALKFKIVAKTGAPVITFYLENGRQMTVDLPVPSSYFASKADLARYALNQGGFLTNSTFRGAFNVPNVTTYSNGMSFTTGLKLNGTNGVYWTDPSGITNAWILLPW